MAKWTKPEEGLPDDSGIEVGDRVLLILREVENRRLVNRLCILEATEDGWQSIDDTYGGYSPADAVLWAYEKDVCAIADVLSQ